MSFIFNKTLTTGHVSAYHEISSYYIDVDNQRINISVSSYKDVASKAAGDEPIRFGMSFSINQLPASVLTDIQSLIATSETAIQTLPDWK